MSNLLEIKNLSKSFNDKVVLKDITFNVPPGSIVGFVGDNGAGKSTTFKTVLGLISKDSGTVKIFGEEDNDKKAGFKEKIGVVFDAMNLPANLTIKQLNNVFKKMFNSWNTEYFYRLVGTFSLPTNKKINKFSRGMSMKLSVAVALSHDAKLLLLDEATGGLDPSSREELLKELDNFVKNNDGGILLSSHIMSDVEKIATHIVILRNGEILLNEKKDKVFKDYGFVELEDDQIGLINKNIIVARRNHGSNCSVLVSEKQKLPPEVEPKSISMEELTVFFTRSEPL
ncbi:ABC transporter ATP-binding protein [Salipaludibacillus sp. CUR1]|uniref:ABC transporter ATP-binding protein n=1 Tax=Salipaludibacillus sp. CUR1 TaxID=2820003 RepID=UPI001E6138F9|nr:ABC transporter ATP-binding protein [Salipaludibacillus sp. CUR1]MCE7790891.1 ABC transporter ATP-binding protein [Salipaludibacillus sp. CUR1]